MSSMKRLITTFSGNLEVFLNQVENHAKRWPMPRSAISGGPRSARKPSIASTPGRRAHRPASAGARGGTRTLGQKARKCADTDHEKALACLRRMKLVESQITSLQSQERQNHEVETRLFREVHTIDEKISALRRQRNRLACRQAVASAQQRLDTADSGAANVEEIFERWEVKVSGQEALEPTSGPVEDELETSFAREEEKSELEEKLKTILKKE